MTTSAAIESLGTLGWILATIGWAVYLLERRAHRAYREASTAFTLRAVAKASELVPDYSRDVFCRTCGNTLERHLNGRECNSEEPPQ